MLIWTKVRWAIATGRAASIEAACAHILRCPLHAPHPCPPKCEFRVVVTGSDGTVLANWKPDTDVARLRQWYQAAERARSLEPESDFAIQCHDWLDNLPATVAQHAADSALMRSLEFDTRAGKSARSGNYTAMVDKAESAAADALDQVVVKRPRKRQKK